MNDSFVTTVSAESMSMEDGTGCGKDGLRSLSDLFKDGLSCSSLDFFACSSSDLMNEKSVFPGAKVLLQNLQRHTGRHLSKGAAGSISDLLDASDSWDLDEFQPTSIFTSKKSSLSCKSRQGGGTQRWRPVHTIPHRPSETEGAKLVELAVPRSSTRKKGLSSFLAKSKEGTQHPKVKENRKVNEDPIRKYLTKIPVNDTVKKDEGRDAPPRGAKRLPSMDSKFMDSWQSKSSDSVDSNHKTPLYPYLQADKRKPANGCDASVASEISAITWSSGVSSLGMRSEDDNMVADRINDSEVIRFKEPCIRHSLDEALQGSFNFIEDDIPKRPARRRTPSPPLQRRNHFIK